MKILSSLYDQFDACPLCGAEPGSPCVRMSARLEFRHLHFIVSVHPARGGTVKHKNPLARLGDLS